MNLFRALIMSVGMFTVFPVPRNSWNDDYTSLVIPAFPAVGALIGVCWYMAALSLAYSAVPIQLQSAALALLPFFLSGFLHIDGYMDTADAILSRRELEEKRRILKDSRVGAFAVIALACLFLLQYCAVFAVIAEGKETLSFAFIPIMSRSAAGLALLNLRPMSENGLAVAFKAGTTPRHTIFLAVAAAAGLIAAYWLGQASILPPLAAAAFAGAITAAYVYKNMRGISGDLCGCVITVSELAGLLCLAAF